ncbi:MAG: hypothetical protein JXA93_23205 [Anaerolineae bacterium]|nr:hypothetical protein [Anaerolineae bacterium]
MFEKRIEIEGAERLTLLEMAGNVALEGWDERALLVRMRDGQEEDLTLEEGESGPVLSARTDVEIRLPGDLGVNARNVHGNLAVDRIVEMDAEQIRGNLALDRASRVVVAEVYGNLKADAVESVRVPGTVYGSARLKSVEQADVQNVRGELVVKGAGHLRATRVGGNLIAKQISAGIDVDEVGGNATLKDIDAPVSIDRVAGNLVAKNMAGGLQGPRIGGNVVIGGPLAAAKSYHVRADGNAVIRLPEGSGADVTLQARGRVVAPSDLKEDEETRGRWTGQVGGGGAELFVEARGNIILGGDNGGGWTISVEMSEDIARQMEEAARQVEEAMRSIDLEAIGRQVSGEVEEAMSRLRVKLEAVDWERMGHRTEEAINRAMSRIQQDMDRMAERAARYQERAARQQAAAAERQARVDARAQARAARHEAHGATANGPDAWANEMEAEAGQPDGWQEGAGSGGADLNEERLSILRMVEQGQISPNEAEMLLDALE